MDYKAIAKAILLCGSEPSVRRCEKECPYYKGGDTKKCIPRMTKDASAAITGLIARAEAAEAELKQKEEYYGQMIDALAALDSTDLEETKEKLKAAESELTDLRRLQPVQMDETGANVLALAVEVSELRQRLEASEARAEKAERERDGFKQRYIEMTNRACELSEIVEENGLED